MTAYWRKSSHSGHAGQNCVEIALSSGYPTKSRTADSARLRKSKTKTVRVVAGPITG